MIATSIILVAAPWMTLRLAGLRLPQPRRVTAQKASMKVMAAETANTIRRPPANPTFRHRFGTHDPSALTFLVNDSARGSRCLSLMVWLGNTAHPRLDLGSGRRFVEHFGGRSDSAVSQPRDWTQRTALLPTYGLDASVRNLESASSEVASWPPS